MPKPTLAQRNSFKTWLRYNKPKFANTTIPEFYLDDILSSTASGISTTDNVRVIPFNNFETVDITTDEANDTLFYLPALPGDRVTVSFGSTSVALSMFGEDTGVTLESSGITYVLNQSIPIARGRALTIKGLGGALFQSTNVPVYEVTPSSTNVDEGSTISFTVNTENAGIGTTLYYGTLVGAAGSSATSNDLDALTGSFTVVGDGTATGGIGTVTRTIASDLLTEGPETFRLVIRTGSTSGTAVTFTSDVTINDLVPSATIGVSTTNVNEGQSVEFTVNTTNIPDSSILNFSTGGTVVAADFDDNTLTGTLTVVGTGSSTGIVTFTRTLIAEGGTATEGSENFNIVITNGVTGAALTTTPSITINDVIPSYNVAPSVSTVAEGDSVTFTINTTNVGDGTQLYWREEGNASSNDWIGGGTGNFLVNNNVGIVTITTVLDWNNENENIILSIRTGSTSGTITTTSSAVTITDTAPSNVTVVPSATTVNEGGSVTFTITGTNIPDHSSRYRAYIIGSASIGDDFTNTGSSFKSFGITNNTGSVTLDVKDDFLSEGIESFYVEFRYNSATSNLLATSPTITINDTSREPGSAANGFTFGPVQVNRDNGQVSNTTDWYKICNIDDIPDGSSIALFIDTSGSMTQSTIQASYNEFLAKLNERNITITSVTNSNEDWITPFLVDLP
jgi:hypothetical protein